MTNASRAQIDLEALARDLRHEEAVARAHSKNDPLAELAKIVGQDDPFRALLAARDNTRPAHETEASATQHVASAHEQAWSARGEPRFGAEESARPNPADAFDQYLASKPVGAEWTSNNSLFAFWIGINDVVSQLKFL